MSRRLLNIASVVCLVACVALMGVWVRSYRWLDSLTGPLTDRLSVGLISRPGQLSLEFIQETSNAPRATRNRGPKNWAIRNREYGHGFEPYMEPNHLGFKHAIVVSFPWSHPLRMPGLNVWGPSATYWFLVLTTGSLAMLCQFRWPPRFTLRSLFIATTFLAVVLGMIAWLDRAWIGK